MSEERKRYWAHEVFTKKFLSGLRTGRARHVGPYDNDPPTQPSVERTPDEIVDAFIAKFPEYQEYRRELAIKHLPVPKCSFLASSWARVTGLPATR